MTNWSNDAKLTIINIEKTILTRMEMKLGPKKETKDYQLG